MGLADAARTGSNKSPMGSLFLVGYGTRRMGFGSDSLRVPGVA